MAQELGITVRRARARDADAIAAFVNRALAGQVAVDRVGVIQRLGSVGFLLAERDGDLLGLLGWQVENLVARVTDFLVWSTSERVAVSRMLLAEMEQAAGELQCETVVLFVPYAEQAQMVEFWNAFGYEVRAVADLPKVWQEAAREAPTGDIGTVLVKQLRDRRVVRPL